MAFISLLYCPLYIWVKYAEKVYAVSFIAGIVCDHSESMRLGLKTTIKPKQQKNNQM